MNKVSSLIVILASLGVGHVAKAESNQDRLVRALCATESRGNVTAVGDNGLAYGILQMHNGMVMEANRLGHTHYSHEDAFNPNFAIAMARTILSCYDQRIMARTGRHATMKELAFTWNGGFKAWKRVTHPIDDRVQANLERYWVKVSKNLDA